MRLKKFAIVREKTIAVGIARLNNILLVSGNKDAPLGAWRHVRLGGLTSLLKKLLVTNVPEHSYPLSQGQSGQV